MQETITVTLPQEIQAALEVVTRQEGLSPDELIGKAITEYLFFRRLRLLRERLIAQAQTQGIATDQDVFDRIS